MGSPTIYSPFFKTSTLSYSRPEPLFPDLFLATGSGSLHLHSHIPQVTICTQPQGSIFLTSRPGTHAHVQHYQINAHMFDSLQILFTSGIWFSCVQVLGHHTSTPPLHVYNQHWHVIIPSESQLHL